MRAHQKEAARYGVTPSNYANFWDDASFFYDDKRGPVEAAMRAYARGRSFSPPQIGV
jgi:hypothetical protein